MLNKKGLTIIELIAILVVLGIIATISMPLISNVIQNSRIKADQLSLDSLNSAVSYYNVNNSNNPLGEQDLTEEEIIELLVENLFLSSTPNIQAIDAAFIWSSEDSVFRLEVEGETLPLSPYGDTYDEITPEIISDMQEYYNENDSYARTWGDYRYTDLGLDPDDWSEPILHISYTPSGSQLRLSIEDGYEAVFELTSGEIYVLPSTYNYSIIYNDLDGEWYYHTIDSEKEIKIDTLQIRITT